MRYAYIQGFTVSPRDCGTEEARLLHSARTIGERSGIGSCTTQTDPCCLGFHGVPARNWRSNTRTKFNELMALRVSDGTVLCCQNGRMRPTRATVGCSIRSTLLGGFLDERRG